MDVIEAIKGRRSIRKYKSNPIPDDLPKELLESATTIKKSAVYICL